MQPVCYANRKDLHFLWGPNGYLKNDLPDFIPAMKNAFAALGLKYEASFVCFSVLPDCDDPYDFTKQVTVFGDTPLILSSKITCEVMLTCTKDLQTTAYNAWKKRHGKHLSETYRRMVRDLSGATDLEKRDHLSDLALQFGKGSYAEA